jgi:hypothetical protein
MTTREMLEIAERNNDEEFGEFKRIVPPDRLSNRPDLHAFLLLDKLIPAASDMVSAAEHDEIWLSIDIDDLAKVITEADIIALTRCGVRFDEDSESLAMFV